MDAIAKAIGLLGYATNSDGIGGLIKARVSDFRVEEISTPVHLDNRGRFTVAKVTLTNWETNRFCNQLSSALKIPRNRVFFAGTKDKRAITTQLFVIDAPQNKVAAVSLPDVEIEVIGRTHQKIGFGNHRGNRFTIVVRGCSDGDGNPLSNEEAMAEVERIKAEMDESLGQGLFPNWIGPQRFGSGRPVTPVVGSHVVRDQWEEAVMAYLSMEGENEEEEAKQVRAHIRENGVSSDVIEMLPRWMGFERRMLEHLLEKPDDFVGAFRKLPGNLQLMTVHALQSVVFNKSLFNRLSAGVPIAIPVPGDIVGRVDEKGQLDVPSCVTVEDRTLPRITRNCQLGRLITTGPLPGSEIRTCEGAPGEMEEATLQAEGLGDVSWDVEAIPRLSTKGTRRSLVTTYQEFSVDTVPIADTSTLGRNWAQGPAEGDRWHPEGACIRFRFTLSSGSYATTLLREYMQSPLNHL
ncbi:MAG: tRNA pseudouridine(13) synthase TruD [Candidatus Poseidonia sp.]|nr:tRNA pseudouridine(13) synthase TruD [Poseidonia sp.]